MKIHFWVCFLCSTSGVWVEILFFVGNKEDAWWRFLLGVLTREQVCTHEMPLTISCYGSNFTVHFGRAQCAPLAVYHPKTGQCWSTWRWRNPFLMVGSGPDNLVKWSWKQPASTHLFFPDVLRPACSWRILRSWPMHTEADFLISGPPKYMRLLWGYC